MKTETKHTPGPWAVFEDDESRTLHIVAPWSDAEGRS